MASRGTVRNNEDTSNPKLLISGFTVRVRVRPPYKPLISLLKSGVFFLFFSEKQARFANGLQNLFGLRSWWGRVATYCLGAVLVLGAVARI
jgi:hypothetical protein